MFAFVFLLEEVFTQPLWLFLTPNLISWMQVMWINKQKKWLEDDALKRNALYQKIVGKKVDKNLLEKSDQC